MQNELSTNSYDSEQATRIMTKRAVRQVVGRAHDRSYADIKSRLRNKPAGVESVQPDKPVPQRSTASGINESSKNHNRRLLAIVTLAGLALISSLAVGSKSTPGPNESEHLPGVATLVNPDTGKLPDGTLSLKVGKTDKHFISRELATVAEAEGKHPNKSAAVSEAIQSESEAIQSVIESRPGNAGLVKPDAHFDVVPDSKVVDPHALKADEDKGYIKPVG